jgi:hypothetical protein
MRFVHGQTVAVGFVDFVAVMEPVLDDGFGLVQRQTITVGLVDFVAIVNGRLDDEVRVKLAVSAVIDVEDFARGALVDDVVRISLGQRKPGVTGDL